MSSPNTNALTYNLYVQQIATLAVLNTTTNTNGATVGVDAPFNALIPSMLNYAELRIQKDLDLLASQIVNVGYNVTAGINTLSISVNDLQTIQTVSYVNGTATTPLLPVSKEFIQNTYTDASSSYWNPPVYFAVYGGDAVSDGNTSNNLLIAPFPDQAYSLSIVGTQWLGSLYATASTDGSGTTYISTNYPDLLVQASMVYVTMYQRNFGPASNDPQMPGSYEAQYQTLLKSAMELENRKKFRDAAWTSQSQSPVATPTR